MIGISKFPITLLEKGIEIKSNQNSLLRDMYLFTELGGIQIKKEWFDWFIRI